MGSRRQLAKQAFPYAAPRPPNEAVVEPRVRSIVLGAIRPAASALEHVDDPADDAAIVHPLDAAHIGRQTRLDALPLLIGQPEQIPIHDPHSSPRAKSFPRFPTVCAPWPAPRTATAARERAAR